MIRDYKHYGTRKRPIAWSSIAKGLMVILAFVWMAERDRTHQQELQSAQQVAHECDDLPVVEMVMPIQGLVQS